MKKKYLMWDMDGTIMNTNDIIIDSWQHTARQYGGEELTVERILSTFGETIVYTASTLWPEEDPKEVARCYDEYQESHLADKVGLFDGIKELLEELRNRGYSLNMVTSRTSETLVGFMKRFGIEDYFDVVITCNDVTEHKPDSRPIRACIERLEARHGCAIDPDDCVMIGDTGFDIGCAINAGVESVLVGWSHPIDEAQLEAAGWLPTYRVKTPEELWELV